MLRILLILPRAATPGGVGGGGWEGGCFGDQSKFLQGSQTCSKAQAPLDFQLFYFTIML